MQEMNNFRSVSDVEMWASAYGVTLTETERQAIIDTGKPSGIVGRWNNFYPSFLQFIVSLGDTAVTLVKTLFASVGMPLILVLLLFVEYYRVEHGIALFETSIATLASISIVLANLTLEFAIHHTELSNGYKPETRTRFSLRTTLSNLAYVLGVGRNFQAQAVSPAWRFVQIRRSLTLTILILALMGSMHGVIVQYDALTWHSAIGQILTQSSLSELVIWLGGLVFTYVTVRLAQVVSAHLAIRASETLISMESQRDTRQTIAMQKAVSLLSAKIAEKQAGHSDGSVSIPSQLNLSNGTLQAVGTDEKPKNGKVSQSDFLAVSPLPKSQNGKH